MFVLKKLLTVFLLPPGIFILGALAAAGVCWRRKKTRQAIGFALAAVLLWIPALKPLAHLLRQGLVADYLSLDLGHVQGDVIILLGGGINDRARDLTGIGVPSDALTARIVTAARLQKRLRVPVIATGGSPYESKVSEAEVIRRFLADLGVAGDQVILEPKSRDTFENAALSLAICRARGFSRAVLVTSDYHMKRAMETFRHAGFFRRPLSRLPAGQAPASAHLEVLYARVLRKDRRLPQGIPGADLLPPGLFLILALNHYLRGGP